MEIVYVPAYVPGKVPGRTHEDEKSFKELVSMMSWPAVPVHRKNKHKCLTRRFQVRQIPMLVLLDSEGKTIHRDITPAVTHIVEDADGESFAGKSFALSSYAVADPIALSNVQSIHMPK